MELREPQLQQCGDLMFFGNPQGLDASRIQGKKGLTCQFSEALTTETSNQSNQSSFLVSAFLMVIILDADASGFSGFPNITGDRRGHRRPGTELKM